MGVGTKRPPLPAPTISSLNNSSTSTIDAADVDTSVSRRTEASSISIPDDGSPLTIPTKKLSSHARSQSQTSLLIEYFEASKEKGTTRPSVRVKVTPSGKKSKTADGIKITKSGKERTPSYTRRISLTGNNTNPDSRAIDGATTTHTINNVNSATSPLDVEFFGNDENQDEPRYIAAPSDISSMPADSMLDEPLTIKSPEEQGSRNVENLDREEAQLEQTEPIKSTLKAPETQRSRSVSRERIAQKVLQKLAEDRSPELIGSGKPSSSNPRGLSEENLKAASRRSSRSRRESGTESSLLKPRDGDSNVSSNSKVSLNNPKLLQMVEDSIRRLILPEIQDIKRQQSVRSSRYRDSMITESGATNEHGLTKSDLSYEEREIGRSESKKDRKTRRTSKESASERSSHRRGSTDTTSRDLDREHRHRSRESTRSSETGSRSLTAEALRDHEYEERRERRKKRSKHRSQTELTPSTKEGAREVPSVPPLPMASDVADSELTRESILSAETAESVGLATTSAKSPETPIQEVTRGSPRAVVPSTSRPSTRTSSAQRKAEVSPANSRTPSQRNLRGVASDRSLGNKGSSAALAAAGLGGAAAAIYGYNSRSSSRREERTAERVATPVDRSVVPEDVHSSEEVGQSVTAPPEATQRELVPDTPVEERTLVPGRSPGDLFDLSVNDEDHDVSEFYEDQHRLNDEYRSSMNYDSQRESSALDETIASRAIEDPQVQGVGANPQYVDTPTIPESAVASLLDQSVASNEPSDASPARNEHYGTYPTQTTARQITPEPESARTLTGHEENSSRDRWSFLKENAKALSNSSKENVEATGSPQGSAPRSVRSEEPIQMTASGVPDLNDPMPEIGHGLEGLSDSASQRSLKQKQSSILEGPLGDENESRDHWPYDPTPEVGKRRGFVIQDEVKDEDYHSPGNTAMMGAAAGVATGLGIGALAGSQFRQEDTRSLPREESAPPSREELGGNTLSNPQQLRDMIDSQGLMKDEGYISAAQPRSVGADSPLSFSKGPPKLFDEADATDEYEQNRGFEPATRDDDAFVGSSSRPRYLSGNSHGMQSPFYDASTGRGINNIQSKDVVALMDHLTVRDGERNARDTEILVTLVRNAAEMRTNFDDIKKFVETQNQMAANKVIGETRSLTQSYPQPLQRVTTADEEPGKKKNIFKRALRGLGSKSTTDLTRIEDMLTHLLSEVESLKAQSGYPGTAGQPIQMSNRNDSLDSYERLRLGPESGYEPEGQAGTGSTPNRSGNFSASTLSRQVPPRFSGYGSEKRVSTVLEADENQENHNEYENDDGMLTPTQEAQQSRSVPFTTPMRQVGYSGVDSNEVTPNTGETDGKARYKSGSSSLWGIPRISRWSKTTASSAPDNKRDTMYTNISQSGSDIDVIPPQDAYMRHDDDRLRSANSLAREDGELPPRSPSPLLPADVAAHIEDPKYQSRHKSLLLQHPQPRQGSTHRHGNNLESQAYGYPRGNDGLEQPISPVSEVFGSVPQLARLSGGNKNGYSQQTQQANRLSGNSYNTASSPISSFHSGYSGRSGGENIHQATPLRAYAPPIPPKIRGTNTGTPGDEGVTPLVPPKIPYDHHDVPESNAVDAASAPLQSRGGPGALMTAEQWNEYLEREAEWDEYEDPTIPLPRKQSPYSPGGLLAPIEERYSMEGDRASLARTQSQRSAGVQSHNSYAGRDSRRFSYEMSGNERDSLMLRNNLPNVREQQHMQQLQEEEERSETPTNLVARPALGAYTSAGLAAGETAGVRKLTGPREMPPSSRNASGASSAGGRELMGTLRRKPVAGAGVYDDWE